ncbi:unnamed protein product [Prunus armeniaca]
MGEYKDQGQVEVVEKTGAGGRAIGSGCLEKLTVGEEVGVAVRERDSGCMWIGIVIWTVYPFNLTQKLTDFDDGTNLTLNGKFEDH